MQTYRVTGRPLTVNGETLAVGAEVGFSDEDAAVFIKLGRIEAATADAALLLTDRADEQGPGHAADE